VANLAETLIMRGAHQGGEKPERIRPTTITQRAIFHFGGKHFGVFGKRIGGAAHGFAGKHKLHFVREHLPIGGLHGFSPFAQPFWQGRGVFNAVRPFRLEKVNKK
jgi:hypothetical protein